MTPDKAITPDQERRLAELEAYVVDTTDKSPTAYWDGFHEVSLGLDLEAFAQDADAELLGRYTNLLANADELGFKVPDNAMREPGELAQYGESR